MSHSCALVISEYDDCNEIAMGMVGNGYDYFSSREEDSNQGQWYKGLIIKKEKEKDYDNAFYNVDGEKYISNAKIEDIDWERTKKESDIFALIDYRMMIDKYDFSFVNDKEAEDIFWDFLMKRLEAGNYVMLVDIHN